MKSKKKEFGDFHYNLAFTSGNTVKVRRSASDKRFLTQYSMTLQLWITAKSVANFLSLKLDQNRENGIKKLAQNSMNIFWKRKNLGIAKFALQSFLYNFWLLSIWKRLISTSEMIWLHCGDTRETCWANKQVTCFDVTQKLPDIHTMCHNNRHVIK